MPSETQKTVAGALLVGASVLSGNALLMTIAGGVGINWASEGLAGLWQRPASFFGQRGTPIARAGEQAIRRAIDELRQSYRHQADSQADLAAFDLVSECAAVVAQAQYPSTTLDPLIAQQSLEASLDELLHGHAAKQFIKERLLDKVAFHFRNALAADEDAWRVFYGWLLEQMATQNSALQGQLAQLPEVLSLLRDQARASAAFANTNDLLQQLLNQLHSSLAQMAQQPYNPMAQQPDNPTPIFDNEDLEVEGNLFEIHGNFHLDDTTTAPMPNIPTQAPPQAPSFKLQRVKVKGDAYMINGHMRKQTGQNPHSQTNTSESPSSTQANQATRPEEADTN